MTGTTDERLSAVVIIATYRRPDHVRTCLEHLSRQTVSPDRIVVVDASPDERTRTVVGEFGGIEYRRNDAGIGATATSRAIGAVGADEDIIVFIDDDAYAEPEWLEELLAPYSDAGVGAVGGRALNGRPGEESEGLDRIGRLLPDGELTGNFGADPGRIIEIDHMLGASMSVRADALRAIGGIRDHYPGTCLREETDLALRVKKAGYRIVFTPRSVALHVAGEYARGRRFDLRYRYYGARNHILLLTTALGWRDPHLLRHLGRTARSAAREATAGLVGWSGKSGLAARARGVAGGLVRAAVDVGGTIAGLVVSLRPIDRAAPYAEGWTR